LSRQGGGPNQVWVHLGVQEQPAQKSMPRSHTESVLDVLYMDGKIIWRFFQWNWSQAQIHLDSTGIIETIRRPESVIVLRHHLLGCWPKYQVGVHYGRGYGVMHAPTIILSAAAAILGLRFCLVLVFLVKLRLIRCNCGDKSFDSDPGPSFLFYTSVAISSFVIRAWNPSWSLLHTHLQFQIACLPFLACVLWFACRKSLLGEVNQIVFGW